MNRKFIHYTILMTCLIGVFVAALSLQAHYVDSSFCTLDATFDCDAVNQSSYSTLLGIPVALLGLLSYVLFVVAQINRNKFAKLLSFKLKEYLKYLAYFATFMFLFSLYLTSIEIFVINAYCYLCLISQLMTLILGIFSWIQVKTI